MGYHSAVQVGLFATIFPDVGEDESGERITAAIPKPREGRIVGVECSYNNAIPSG